MNELKTHAQLDRLYSGRWRFLLLFAIFLGILASRRWEQLASPQVWDEEGRLISGCIHNGWFDLLIPVNGYLLLVPKLIVRASLAVSFYRYPLVAAIATLLFNSSVGLAVATAPTRLKGKAFCAAAIYLVPSNTEVFGPALLRVLVGIHPGDAAAALGRK